MSEYKGSINIAIDGPSGSGKSTLAKAVAAYYGYIYIDTGALYRTIGLYIQRKGLASDDKEGIIAALPEIDISMRLTEGKGEVLLFGKPVGDEIRTPRSSVYASDVSKIPEVRAFLLNLQRDIAAKHDTVMDGRDIGTVILPDARVKIFLTASDSDRAERRYGELSQKGIKTTLKEVLDDMRWRDENDKSREIAPAIPAQDAILIDNSGFSPADTFAAVKKIVDERLEK